MVGLCPGAIMAPVDRCFQPLAGFDHIDRNRAFGVTVTTTAWVVER